MSATMNETARFTVSIWHTPRPGYQYEARIYHGGERVFVAGGMTAEDAELAASVWIANYCASQLSEATYIRSYVVEQTLANAACARSEPR